MFTYHGNTYRYFDHPYNKTRRNERAVELPVAFAWLDQQTGHGVEIGNVTGHYRPARHRVIDLYEPAPGVDNLDVFDLTGPVDWALSISTLEHVRWDPPEQHDPNGAAQALRHLESIADRMLITVPLGCNPVLDDLLMSGGTNATRACTLVRNGRRGWEQSRRLTYKPYRMTTRWAEAVWIGEW